MVLGCTLVIGLLDWLTGYELNFFAFYFVPVSLAAWHLGLGASRFVAVTNALVWLAVDIWSGHAYSSAAIQAWNTAIRLCSFLVISWSVRRIHCLLVLENEKSEALRKSISQIKVLEGLLPTCAQCKKIRDLEGKWEPMEVYIGDRSNAQFSHGLCPECVTVFMEQAREAFPSMSDTNTDSAGESPRLIALGEAVADTL
jgi:hypothetical protein